MPYADGKGAPVRMGDPHVFGDDPATATRFFPAAFSIRAAFQSGGSGLAGTAADFMTFLQALQRGGEPILKRETLAMASRNHIGDLPREDAGWRFGLISAVLDDPVAAKTPLSVGTLEWGGIWGHRWFVDPAAGIAAATLSNTTHGRRQRRVSAGYLPGDLRLGAASPAKKKGPRAAPSTIQTCA